MLKTIIVTRYFAPTQNLPSRIRAYLPSGRFYSMNYDQTASIDENHERAAKRVVLNFYNSQFPIVSLSRPLPTVTGGGVAHVVAYDRPIQGGAATDHRGVL